MANVFGIEPPAPLGARAGSYALLGSMLPAAGVLRRTGLRTAESDHPKAHEEDAADEGPELPRLHRRPRAAQEMPWERIREQPPEQYHHAREGGNPDEEDPIAHELLALTWRVCHRDLPAQRL